ncbi:hypothetical protein J7W19_32535 [Streptomyces mobaraensis NBRC 13819 = DSM 40847]|uniref:Uncharacterized protein n=1 Tax=Streptomyces mobaraensis (strain ATCC 29032 / DSM 40847 / JCM 4168 / NBRC 13819 / NCIMB 11159 / IPCR 16-22) TaxID=1223523 RepID=M3BY68_STRM1|nr:hypothetical protein [Streptomyces mobaraensis]EME96710.1 hypothetical protein H340_30116 [Streptomyces mobaraensis NBRC 13819 = DSM 40847]QTT72029.1 hypothetical protein J7W19_00015 [Streptomyces mobaraensis NBRC 13819 = DSM 40847]QTT77470.1 hypothetical protein J7W19_32535 [Streptomyces mobaraensis NBRC 13819 = DSM 40847]
MARSLRLRRAWGPRRADACVAGGGAHPQILERRSLRLGQALPPHMLRLHPFSEATAAEPPWSGKESGPSAALGPEQAKSHELAVPDRIPDRVGRQADPRMCEGVDDQDVVAGLPDQLARLAESAACRFVRVVTARLLDGVCGVERGVGPVQWEVEALEPTELRSPRRRHPVRRRDLLARQIAREEEQRCALAAFLDG